MIESVELFAFLFALSFGFWLLYGFYVSIRVQMFIVKRFEVETDLARTKYFRELMPWLKYTPTFIRSPLYIAHLLTFVWGWARNKDNFKEKLEKKKKMNPYYNHYDDIDGPEQFTRHFTKKEMRRMKILTICYIIVSVHTVARYAFKFIWPEAFS